MIEKIKKNIKYIKLSDIGAGFIFLIILFPSLVIRKYNKIFNKKILLVIENGYTARDNGYHFYKYMRTKHKNEKCYYVIDKKSNDYEKVKKYGNIIQYKSMRHWLFYLSSKYNISNQKDGNPNAVIFYIVHVMFGLFNNRVFLQHGITKDDSEWLYYENCKFKYFICGAKREYEYIKTKFGYPEGNVIYTGFPRFDNLYNNQVTKNQILIMPTWRNWLGRSTNFLGEKFEFKNTKYYKCWSSFINDKKIIEYIEKNDIKLLFYPHMNMQKFLGDFRPKSENIKVLSMNEDIQKTLKSSSIMITDYSSVYMDFGYMLKPVIYYQFDYNEYRSKQYSAGYFDYKNDGFGPVVYNKKKLIKEIMNIYENNLDKKYYKRMNDFFELKDQNNCERIFNILN